MKRKQIIVVIAATAALLVGILLLLLFFPKQRTLKNPIEHYAKAVGHLSGDKTTRLQIETDTETATPSVVFTQNSNQVLTLYYQDGSLLQAHAQEQLNIGDQTISLTEVLQDETVFINFDGGMFRSESSLEAFMAERAPAILLTAENYQNITGVAGLSGSTISFDGAYAPEAWAIPDGAAFISAEGTAQLTKNGALSESTYSIRYSLSDVIVTKHYRVSIETPPSDEPVRIADTEAYIALSHPAVLRQLEQMCGYLLQAEAINASYSEYIFCQVFGDERTRSIELQMQTAPQWTAAVQTNVQLKNTSRVGDATQMQQTETLENGEYSLTVNGIREENHEITEEQFQSYCRNLLVGTVILPKHITGVTLKEEGNICYLEFTANDALAQIVSTDACRTLYQDPELLNNMASSQNTESMVGYISYEKNSGLPLSSGIRYNGSYTISELPYRMEFRAEQTYDILQK